MKVRARYLVARPLIREFSLAYSPKQGEMVRWWSTKKRILHLHRMFVLDLRVKYDWHTESSVLICLCPKSMHWHRHWIDRSKLFSFGSLSKCAHLGFAFSGWIASFNLFKLSSKARVCRSSISLFGALKSKKERWKAQFDRRSYWDFHLFVIGVFKGRWAVLRRFDMIIFTNDHPHHCSQTVRSRC